MAKDTKPKVERFIRRAQIINLKEGTYIDMRALQAFLNKRIIELSIFTLFTINQANSSWLIESRVIMFYMRS